jgi:hypothetical protein
MKLDILALTSSEFNQTFNDAAWRAGVTLWCRAWHQVPCGSLPADDAALCSLAGLGRDVKTWMKLRKDALHGFIKCADGRLYNRTLCAFGMEVFEGRKKARERMARKRAENVRVTEHEQDPIKNGERSQDSQRNERACLHSTSPTTLPMSKDRYSINKERESPIGSYGWPERSHSPDGEDF